MNKNKLTNLYRECREAEEEVKQIEEEARRITEAERELLATPPPLIIDVESVQLEEPSTSMVCGPILELVSTIDIKEERLSPVNTSESFKSFEEVTASLFA